VAILGCAFTIVDGTASLRAHARTRQPIIRFAFDCLFLKSQDFPSSYMYLGITLSRLDDFEVGLRVCCSG
jgi:hypothetical protein